MAGADALVFDVTFFLAASAAQVLAGSTPANAINPESNSGIKFRYIVMVGLLCLDHMIYCTRFSGASFQVPSKASTFGQ
jgi:hypothetical protein